MKKTLFTLGIALAFNAFFALICPFTANAAPQRIPLPKDVFEWVQSSARVGYWFNKAQMCYGVTDGVIDKNRLIVPTIRLYDDLQIKEVTTKRRWHNRNTNGYDKLTGAAEYLEFNLSEGSVTVQRHDDLDNTWTTLSTEMPNKKYTLSKMSDNNIEKKFYLAILNYAQAHSNDVMVHSLGKGKVPQQKKE